MSHLRSVLTDGGKGSFSRTFPAIYSVLVVGLWVAVGVMILRAEAGDRAAVWASWDGWLTWGRDFGVITVLPYLGNTVSKMGQGRRHGRNERERSEEEDLP